MGKDKNMEYNTKCAYCGRGLHRIPSRIRRYNFCNPEHTKTYLRSNKNIDFGKGWKHTPEEIEKIRQASLNMNRDKVLTSESRRKMAIAAKNKIWTKESREKLKLANKGKKLSESTKRKIRIGARFGRDNVMWKADLASYYAIHLWITHHIGKTKKCNDCGKISKEGKIELSNKDHKYRRNIEDWEWRCVPCHRKYDYEHGLVNPKGKALRFFSKSTRNK